ncbi:bile acid:sodium symporter [Lentisphaerota bacterium ZTH]|nr:bile acid:sodium symporter [Lentisphaerota bacterium]WET06699.1 bile acid:sodium symporter [Lentisphaerota bacterium ZTH]
MFKKLILPVGLLLVILLALCQPGPGIWMKDHYMIEVYTFFMFLGNGWLFRASNLKVGRSFFMMSFAAVLFLLIAGPLAGIAAVNLFGYTSLYALGFIVMAAMPPTLSSCVVVTEVAGGNPAASLFMTVALNLLSIFSLPIVLPIALGSSEDIGISGSKLLYKLLLIVLLPFFCGISLKRLIKKDHFLISYVPLICVLLTVLAAFSSSRELLFNIFWRLPSFITASAAIHLLLMLLAWAAARCLNFDRRDTTAFAFTVSQKTMPIALGVLSTFGGNIAEAFAVCIIFHMTQLLVDSVIAAALPLQRYRCFRRRQEVI